MTATARILLALAVLGFLVTPALAGDPAFKYVKKDKEETKKVEWKASAQGGLITTTGNSRNTSFAAGAKASRKQGFNKLELEANTAYVRSAIFLANDANGDMVIDPNEVSRPSSTTTKSWLGKARYDRFLTEHNSLYLTGLVSADEPAGKEFVGGGQVGYSRQLFKNKKHEVVGESGYDFSYENLVVGPGVPIHSARLFAGYTGKLTKDTGLDGSVELLSNFNKLKVGDRDVGSFEDTRVKSKLALTTKLYKDISFRFAFSADYDNAPAPRAPFKIPYATGFEPLADKLDTKTEATLIINFL